MNELYTKLQDDNHLFDAYFVIKNDLILNLIIVLSVTVNYQRKKKNRV